MKVVGVYSTTNKLANCHFSSKVFAGVAINHVVTCKYWHRLDDSNISAPPNFYYATGLEDRCREQTVKISDFQKASQHFFVYCFDAVELLENTY